MKPGRILEGVAGKATEILCELHPGDPLSWTATVALWFLNCPGQSPAWSCYLLSCVHLREIPGTSPPILAEPGMTHEVMLVALDPYSKPDPANLDTWRTLRPFNYVGQIRLPDDDKAQRLLEWCARAVLAGHLPAEPLLSGQVEPWRSTLQDTAEHLRGEHDPVPEVKQ